MLVREGGSGGGQRGTKARGHESLDYDLHHAFFLLLSGQNMGFRCIFMGVRRLGKPLPCPFDTVRSRGSDGGQDRAASFLVKGRTGARFCGASGAMRCSHLYTKSLSVWDLTE